MPDDSSEYRIRIATTADTAGAERTLAVLDQVGAATVVAGEQAAAGAAKTVTANEGVMAAIQQAAAATAVMSERQLEAGQVAVLFNTNMALAERGLALLGAEAGTAQLHAAELEAAMEAVAREASQGVTANAAYAQSIRATAAETIAAAATQDEFGTMSQLLTARLTQLSISEAEVAVQATKLGLSMEVAGRALLQIKNAALAEEVTAARIAIEEATAATAAQTIEQEAETIATVESTVATKADTEALAQRAIMMRRASDGLVDLAIGGRRAVQGVADLQYVLTSLFPQGAAVIGVLGGTALIGELWEHITQKMAKDHKETADKIKAQHSELVETLKADFSALGQSATSSFDSMIGQYKLLAEQLTASIRATKELQEANDELKSAKLAAQIAQIDSQEERDLEGQPSDVQARIKREYTGKRLNLRQEFDQDKAREAAGNVQTELDQVQSQLATKKKELADEDAKYAGAVKDEDEAYRGLIGSGAKSDVEAAQDRINALQGKAKTGDASSDELVELRGLLDRIDAMVEKQSINGPSFDEQLKNLPKELADKQKFAAENPDEASGERAAADALSISDQIKQMVAYQSYSKTLAEITKKNSEGQLAGQAAITEMQGKVDALSIQVQTALLKVDTLKVVDTTQSAQNAADTSTAEAKAQFEHREAARYVQEEAQQKIIDNPTATPDQKARARAEQDRLKAQTDRDKIASGSAMGLSNDEITRAGGKLDVDQAKPGFVITAQNQKDQKIAATAEHKELQGAVEEATRALEASGNKPLIESFRKLAAGADLQQKGAILLAELATASVAQHDLIEQRLQRAENAIHSLTNHH